MSGLKAPGLTFFVTDFHTRGHDLNTNDNEWVRVAHFSHPEIPVYPSSHPDHLRLVIITDRCVLPRRKFITEMPIVSGGAGDNLRSENTELALTSAAAEVHNVKTRHLPGAQHLTPRLKMNQSSSLS